MSPCPRCARPNAPHREACLYCGARMPAPTAPPPPKKEKVLPADLDALVRRAMTGKGVHELRRALEEARAAPEPEAGAEPEARTQPEVEARAEPEVAADPHPAPAEPTAAALLERLADAARRATDAHVLRQWPTFLEALDAIDEASALLRGCVPPPDEPLRLPTGRHPYALALAVTDLQPELLAAMYAIDLPTARAGVAAGGTRVILRSADRAELERRAARGQAAGMRVKVLDADALRAFGPAHAIVAAGPTFRGVNTPVWELPPDPSSLPRGEPIPEFDPWLLVLGEVEERRLVGAAATSRWQRARYAAPAGAGTDSRAAVLDLHTATGILRIREGACDWRELPGYDASSQRRSMRTFVEAASARWPAMRVEPRRVCAAEPRPGDTRATGWAAWEEHSRICRAVWANDAPT